MALTTVSANSHTLQVSGVAATLESENGAGIFGQVMESVDGVANLPPAQADDNTSILGYSDEQISRYIDYQSTQLHPLFHITFKDWWAQGGITAPHQEPWIRETAANALRATDARTAFNAARGLPPPERPWEGDFMAELVSKREAYARQIDADQSSPVRTTVGAGADLSKPWNPYVSVSEGLQYSRKYSLSEVAELRNVVSEHFNKPEQLAGLLQQKAYSAADVALATRQTLDQVQGLLAQTDWLRNSVAGTAAPASVNLPPVGGVASPQEGAPGSPLATVVQTTPSESSQLPVSAALPVPGDVVGASALPADVDQRAVKPLTEAVIAQIQDLWANRAEPEVVREFMDLQGLLLDDLARVTGLSTTQLQTQWLTGPST